MIRIFSDLHLEFGIDIVKKCKNFCELKKVKYTILAGDITNFTNKSQDLSYLISEIRPYTDHIIYVLGNHEYYESKKSKINDVRDSYKSICNDLNITLLENEYLETDDFIFYGATMWTDITKIAFDRMNDKYSFESINELLDIHKESKSKLEEFVNEYKSKKPLVVITHHLPSFSLIDKEYEKYKDTNSGFASELDYLIKNPISYWIYGHTHMPNNSTINNVKLFCNPAGYPGKERINFKDHTF